MTNVIMPQDRAVVERIFQPPCLHPRVPRDTLFNMQRSILAVSPNSDFLEQIRSHLEEGGRYRVQCVTSVQDALALANSTLFDLAILDAESSDVPFVPFTRDLVAAQPGLKLLVFPPQNNPHHPALNGLVTNGFLNKPFFTPEVGKALTTIFQSNDIEPELLSENSDDLAKLWTQQPEIGFHRIEQLLGSTSASVGLLITRGQVIAGSGLCPDATIQIILNLLDSHPFGSETSELMRFITPDNEPNELFVYASLLIRDVTMVLIYPSNTSISSIRFEVSQVKREFKLAYPTTGELRLDLRPDDKVEEVQKVAPFNANIDLDSHLQNSFLDAKFLIPLEDEIGSDDIDNVLSQVELKNLDALLANMPPPDPDLADLDFAIPPLPVSELEPPAWQASDLSLNPPISINDFDSNLPTKSDFSAQSEQNDRIVSPLATHETSQTDPDIEGTAPPSLENAQGVIIHDPITESQEEMDAVIPPDLPDFDFRLPWETSDTKPSELVPPPLPSLETDSMGNDPEKDELTRAESMPLSGSEEWSSNWLKEEFTDLEETPFAETDPSDSFETPQFNEYGESLSDSPSVDEGAGQTEATNQIQPPSLPVEDNFFAPDPAEANTPLNDTNSIYAINSPEPGTKPLGLNNFRFHYTCLLVPNDPHQFLTRDLSERLGFLLPQLHLGYGWRLTGISIRPQYLLWAITVPPETCPVEIIAEIRRRTTAHIYSNFPELKLDQNSNDFWAPGYLAVSGATPPSISLIFDFVSRTRKSQSTTN
jgi:CheY-like chemotaxis protein/REP element-mobilizing transposase RayT